MLNIFVISFLLATSFTLSAATEEFLPLAGKSKISPQGIVAEDEMIPQGITTEAELIQCIKSIRAKQKRASKRKSFLSRSFLKSTGKVSQQVQLDMERLAMSLPVLAIHLDRLGEQHKLDTTPQSPSIPRPLLQRTPQACSIDDDGEDSDLLEEDGEKSEEDDDDGFEKVPFISMRNIERSTWQLIGAELAENGRNTK
jgi:hypothetical protein